MEAFLKAHLRGNVKVAPRGDTAGQKQTQKNNTRQQHGHQRDGHDGRDHGQKLDRGAHRVAGRKAMHKEETKNQSGESWSRQLGETADSHTEACGHDKRGGTSYDEAEKRTQTTALSKLQKWSREWQHPVIK